MDRKDFLISSGKAMLGSVLMSSLNSMNAAGPVNGSKNNGQAALTLFMAGDVMTGRGIDQVLPQSVKPRIHETYTKSAERYVQLAEQANGSIPKEVSYTYIWGDALKVLQEIEPECSIINLETSVTTSEDYWKGKGIHYRMHPGNTPLLTEAGIDVCVLGNNHVLDWGYEGLRETLQALQQAGMKTAGVGDDPESAAAPAVFETGNGRLLVFSYASPTAGIPMIWSADDDRPGVNMLANISAETAEKVDADIRRYRKEGDRVVLSVHWGGNWGYEIPQAQQEFAHRLIDRDTVDVIHGHSAHHPKGIEVYNDRLILYGCGDLINDYEGIGGHEQYRGELSLMYFPGLDSEGKLKNLTMVPMQINRFQLRRAPDEGVRWLRNTLDRECNRFGHSVIRTDEGFLELSDIH